MKYDDLIVGIPGPVNSNNAAASIHVFYGSSTGLTDVDDQIFDQDTTNIEGTVKLEIDSWPQLGLAISMEMATRMLRLGLAMRRYRRAARASSSVTLMRNMPTLSC